jgi:hypothetical protein
MRRITRPLPIITTQLIAAITIRMPITTQPSSVTLCRIVPKYEVLPPSLPSLAA